MGQIIPLFERKENPARNAGIVDCPGSSRSSTCQFFTPNQHLQLHLSMPSIDQQCAKSYLNSAPKIGRCQMYRDPSIMWITDRLSKTVPYVGPELSCISRGCTYPISTQVDFLAPTTPRGSCRLNLPVPTYTKIIHNNRVDDLGKEAKRTRIYLSRQVQFPNRVSQ
jgi:hypothetical protein